MSVMIAMLTQQIDRLDVLINNAGVHLDQQADSLTISRELLNTAMQTNVFGVRKCIDTVHTFFSIMSTMNVYFVLNGITFSWDEEKARINPINHDGITFQQAAEAFFDPFLILVDASRNNEARDTVIGLDARWNLLYVVHIEQDAESIRIISARKATSQERADYEK
jgi:uncharacterized protein